MGRRDAPVSLDQMKLAVGVVGDGDHAVGRTDLGSVERGGLFGGQLVAQSLSAAALTAPDGSVPQSIQAHFVGASAMGPPVTYEVERVRDGRALQHRVVRGTQEGRLVVFATVVSAIPADGADWQLRVAPRVGPPDRRPEAEPAMLAFLGWDAFEIRRPVADGDDPPTHPFFIRASDEVPDDPWLRGAVRAYWSDMGLNGDARFLHEDVEGPTSSTSATHALWLHRDPPPHEWHLIDVTTQSLAGNQGYVQSWIFHEPSGALVASAGQTVFIRRPR
jgi:acyl-CoA thioesterase-2